MIILDISKEETAARKNCAHCKCCGALIEFDQEITAKNIGRIARCPVCGASAENLEAARE